MSTLQLTSLLTLLLTTVAHAQQPARTPVPAPHSTNAYDYFQAATRAVDKSVQDADIGFPRDLAPPSPKKLGRDRAALRLNARALELLRMGLRYPYVHPANSGDIEFRFLAGMRQLARLLALQGYVDSQSGDWTGSCNCGLNAAQAGVDLSHGSSLIEVLVGIAVEAIGHRAIEMSIPHLTAGYAASAAGRLVTIENGRPTLADIFAREKAHGVRFFERDLAKDLHHTKSAEEREFVLQSADAYKKQFPELMDAVIAISRLPYAAPKPAVAMPASPFAQEAYGIYFPTDRKLALGNTTPAFLYERARTADRLLTVELALQAFRATTGHYPDSLGELVPTQLAAIPADPFALAKPLQYKRTGDTYLLYSIGPDCTDDGGQPIATPGPKGTSYLPKPDSKGDIVAGINTR